MIRILLPKIKERIKGKSYLGTMKEEGLIVEVCRREEGWRRREDEIEGWKEEKEEKEQSVSRARKRGERGEKGKNETGENGEEECSEII